MTPLRAAAVAAILAALAPAAFAQIGPFDSGYTVPDEHSSSFAASTGPASQLSDAAGQTYGGSMPQVAASAGQPFDGNAAKPPAVDAGSADAAAPIKPSPQPKWGSFDPAAKPDGFADMPDDQPKKKGLGEKVLDWMKKDMPGWVFKIGLVIAAAGVFTFNPTVMWVGFCTILAGGLLTALFS